MGIILLFHVSHARTRGIRTIYGNCYAPRRKISPIVSLARDVEDAVLELADVRTPSLGALSGALGGGVGDGVRVAP